MTGLLAIAHRAGNDPVTLREAISAGVDLVELDLWRFRRRLEVRHLKTMGPVPLLWDRHPWRLVDGRAPRCQLADLPRTGTSGTPQLMLDLKGRDLRLSAAVLATMRAERSGTPYVVCSQSWRLLDAFADEPGVRVVHSVGDERMFRAVWRRLAEHGGAGVSIHHRLLTPARVCDLREVAPVVMTWTVNTRERLRTLVDWGVNGVISDDLDMLREVVQTTR